MRKNNVRKSIKIDHPIIGTWRSENIESEWGGVLVEMIFNEDGEYMQNLYFQKEEGEPLTSKGGYLLENEKIVLRTKEDQSTFRFYFNGDILILENESKDTFRKPLKLKRIDSQHH